MHFSTNTIKYLGKTALKNSTINSLSKIFCCQKVNNFSKNSKFMCSIINYEKKDITFISLLYYI